MKKVELIIPNYDNDGSDNSELIKEAIKGLCQSFGGATVYQAKGFWVNDKGHLFEDAVSVIISATETNAMNELEALADMVLKATDQEAVFVSHDGNAKIISK